MFRAFTDIAQLIGQLVPTWLMIPIAIGLGLLALPFWLRSMKSKQISGRARRMVRADPDLRSRLRREILELAGETPALLFTAGQQAIKYDLRDLRDVVLERLEATGKAPEDVAHLRSKIEPEKKPIPHPLEVAVNVERLLEEGMIDTARQRLAEALDRYPDDPDLQELDRQVGTL